MTKPSDDFFELGCMCYGTTVSKTYYTMANQNDVVYWIPGYIPPRFRGKSKIRICCEASGAASKNLSVTCYSATQNGSWTQTKTQTVSTSMTANPNYYEFDCEFDQTKTLHKIILKAEEALTITLSVYSATLWPI